MGKLMFDFFLDKETKARNTLRSGDYPAAYKLLTQLAKKGKPRAMSALGMMHANGHGVPIDFHQARKWFQKAADAGLQEAQVFLGKIYEQGDGVPVDYQEAIYWYESAARDDHDLNEYNYTNGDPLAHYRLGRMYALGLGFEKNIDKAYELFRKSALAGNDKAQYHLAKSYADGLEVNQDYQEAAKWYELAANQWNASAQNNLGILYSKGLGVIQDKIQSHMWFNLASGSGRDDAVFNRNNLSAEMSKSEIEEAQKLARERLKKRHNFA
jgi:TPR repeat protein